MKSHSEHMKLYYGYIKLLFVNGGVASVCKAIKQSAYMNLALGRVEPLLTSHVIQHKFI